MSTVVNSRIENQDNQDSSSSEEEIFGTSDDALPSFNIGLRPGGDEGSSFRTQNDPSAPFQRSNYIERKGAVDIRCSCLDVVHGKFDDRTFATLIVLQFRFDPRKRASRFQSAYISLEFAGMNPGDLSPEVFKIALEGTYHLAPTTQHEEVTRKAGLNAGGGFGGITAGGDVGWEKLVSKDTSDETRIIGSIDLVGRNWGKQNCASWTLLENKTARTGIPTSMQTAILLRRKEEDEQFKCVVKINAEVDLKSTLSKVFGGKGRDPKDDPVFFDTSIESTANLRHYDNENLKEFDLGSVCDVTFAKSLKA